MSKIRARPTAADVNAFIEAADTPAVVKTPKREPQPKAQKKIVTARTTISLPRPLLDKLEEVAFSNKRKGLVLDSVSAIAREAILEYLA